VTTRLSANSFGGLCIDPRARVLRPDGSVIPGLYAADADTATAFGSGYAGGLALALAMAYGRAAAQSAGWGDTAQ
jgi:3-oxosteroid 1-dehydrogenase